MEIYLDVDPGYSGEVFVTIPGVEYQSVYPRPCSPDYDWLAELDSDSTTCPDSQYVQLHPNTLYEIHLNWDDGSEQFDYYYCGAAFSQNIYCGAYGGHSDLVLHIDSDGVLTMRTTAIGGMGPADPSLDFDTIFDDSLWIWPYNYTLPSYGSLSAFSGSNFFLTRQSAPYVSYLDIGVGSIQDVSLSNLTLKFAPQKRLLVKGEFDATTVTFTSSTPNPTPSTGWGGIRFESGSSGTIDNSVISGVGGYGGRSVYIENASPTITGTTIEDPGGYGIHGIYVTGSSAAPVIENNRIQDNSGAGITLTSGGSTIRLIKNIIEDNSGWGLVAGFGTKAFLSPPFGTTPTSNTPATFGNSITGQSGGGIDALSSADLTFGWYYYPTGGFHANGYNSINGNVGDGVQSRLASSVHGGSLSNYKYNLFYGNGGYDGEATGSGSLFYARCDWWNDTSPPFNTSESSGGIVYDDYYLLQNPYSNPTATCTNNSGPMPRLSSGPAPDESFDSSPVLDRFSFVEAVDLAAESPRSAISEFEQILAHGDTQLVGATFGEIGLLASRDDVGTEVQKSAETIIDQAINSNDGYSRNAALRAKIVLEQRRGNRDAAIATAEQLLRSKPTGEFALYANVALSHLYAAAGRKADAIKALAAASQIASGTDDVRYAAEEIAFRFDEPVDQILSAQRSAGKLQSGAQDSVAAVATVESGIFELQSPFPNPVIQQVTVPVRLSEAAQVRISIFDLLGREQLRVQDGPLETGTYELKVPAIDLSSGSYFVHAVFRSTSGLTIASTMPISIIQ